MRLAHFVCLLIQLYIKPVRGLSYQLVLPYMKQLMKTQMILV